MSNATDAVIGKNGPEQTKLRETSFFASRISPNLRLNLTTRPRPSSSLKRLSFSVRHNVRNDGRGVLYFP
jgi:hypothetical protein